MSVSELYRAMGPVAPVESHGGPLPSSGPKAPESAEFEKLFREHLQPVPAPKPEGALKFSNHAETRIRSRAIPWNADLEQRVAGGIDSASRKGSRETLILAGDVAVIANVKSRTVITAMDAASLKERIFTNIDSAVIV